MPVTDKFLGMRYYGEGVEAAQEKLRIWDLPDHKVRQDMISDIQLYLDRVMKSVHSGYTSSFALGYFHTLGKRNDPVLNEIIAPFAKITTVQ